MMALLADDDTSLVVRIGLSAIVESLADSGLFMEYEDDFIALARHQDERIAIDALYYLSLLKMEKSVQALLEIAEKGPETLQQHAQDILQESSSESVLH